jgi:hypothetical protein
LRFPASILYQGPAQCVLDVHSRPVLRYPDNEIRDPGPGDPVLHRRDRERHRCPEQRQRLQQMNERILIVVKGDHICNADGVRSPASALSLIAVSGSGTHSVMLAGGCPEMGERPPAFSLPGVPTGIGGKERTSVGMPEGEAFRQRPFSPGRAEHGLRLGSSGQEYELAE